MFFLLPFVGSQEFLQSLAWSVGPLVHWPIGPLVHWSIGPLVEFQMSKMKCQMSIRLNFCQSLPPEFLRSFLTHGVASRRGVPNFVGFLRGSFGELAAIVDVG